MTLQDIYQGLLNGVENMSWLEVFAVVFAIISVLCARANSIWIYPTGIAGILLSMYIFMGTQYKLYPDVALNLYYLVMSIYGWYAWTHKPTALQENTPSKKPEETPVTWCTRTERRIALMIFLVLWGGLYWWLSTYKINNVPLLDSFCASMACAGMWLLAKRKIENWIFLLISDAVAIPLFFYKKLILFCGLNVLFVIIAWLGFLAWKNIYERQKKVV